MAKTLILPSVESKTFETNIMEYVYNTGEYEKGFQELSEKDPQLYDLGKYLSSYGFDWFRGLGICLILRNMLSSSGKIKPVSEETSEYIFSRFREDPKRFIFSQLGRIYIENTFCARAIDDITDMSHSQHDTLSAGVLAYSMLEAEFSRKAVEETVGEPRKSDKLLEIESFAKNDPMGAFCNKSWDAEGVIEISKFMHQYMAEKHGIAGRNFSYSEAFSRFFRGRESYVKSILTEIFESDDDLFKRICDSAMPKQRKTAVKFRHDVGSEDAIMKYLYSIVDPLQENTRERNAYYGLFDPHDIIANTSLAMEKSFPSLNYCCLIPAEKYLKMDKKEYFKKVYDRKSHYLHLLPGVEPCQDVLSVAALMYDAYTNAGNAGRTEK